MTVRVAIVCSFNLDLVARPFAKAARALGIEPEIYLGPYAQWESELLDPGSKLYAHVPTTTIIFVDAEDALPSLSAEARPTTIADAEAHGLAVWARTERAIAALLERTTGAVWCHTMIAPPRNGLGMLEGNAGYSHTAAIDAFNRTLRAFADRERRVAVFDYAALAAEHGYASWYDARLWHVGRMRLANASISLLAQAYANQLAAASMPRRKCLVLDLDNTLWGGVIGEDGVAGIQLGHSGVGLAYREFQMAILALYRRGVILAVASKNTASEALAAIESHPDMVLRPEHFAVLEINWHDKHESIKRIAERLDIGLDSLVFWDDNPMERGMVRSQLPVVLVPEVPNEPSSYVRALRELVCFDSLGLTAEDQRRGQMYREQTERDTFLEQADPAGLDSYYASLDMVVQIDVASDISIPRIAQLTQRTNQFNLTTRRYTDADVRARVSDPAWRVYSLSLRDRFGDLGLIGAAMLHAGDAAWELDTFLMSCRALGRRVEDAFAAYLVRVAANATKPLHGIFVTTKKTAPIREMLDRHGWIRDEIGNGQFRVELTAVDMPRWLRVQLPEEA